MFAKAQSPQKITPEELDDYLLHGWFRMGQTIFTTNFLNFKNNFYSAIWLRLDLARYEADRTQEKLFKRNAHFHVTIKPAQVNTAHEILYEKYKSSLSFEPSASLKALLFGRSPYQIFNTQEVNVYDGNKLIAAGFFDLGKNSAAGISSFYDPEYKKYSLGKYLIYQKISFCKQQGIRYFYPGYFVPGYSFFDYKLGIGNSVLEYLALASGQWLPIAEFAPGYHPLEVMRNKLSAVHELLRQFQIETKILMYEYFDANLVPGLTEAELLDFPLILWCESAETDGMTFLVVYDIGAEYYRLVQCISVWSSGSPTGPDEFYSSHLLKIINETFSSKAPQAIAENLAILVKEKIPRISPH
jgi:arginine-tRNA-protein transferase